MQIITIYTVISAWHFDNIQIHSEQFDKSFPVINSLKCLPYSTYLCIETRMNDYDALFVTMENVK